MITFVRDDNGVLQRAVDQVLEENDEFDVEGLKMLRWHFTFHMGDLKYDRGRPLKGKVRKLGNHIRDTFDADIELWVNKDWWQDTPERLRKRTLYGLLEQVEVQRMENMEVDTDQDGRVKFRIIYPEIQIVIGRRSFEKFGLAGEDRALVKRLAQTPLGRAHEVMDEEIGDV